MSLFSKSDSSAVGLDIDGRFLAAAVVDSGSIGRLASIDLAPGAAVDGEVTDPGLLGETIKELFATHSLPKQVRLGVGNQQIAVRHLEMPLVESKSERDAAVRFQATDAIAMPLDDAILDYQIVGAHEGSDGRPRQDVMVVAARMRMITLLVEAVKAAGLKPVGIDLNAFALVRVLADRKGAIQDAESPARVICHLGGVTNLAIAVGDTCVFTRTLQTASEDDEAVATSIAEEVRLSIDFYNARADARSVESVVVSGPGAVHASIHDALAARTNLPVSDADPLGSLGAHTVPSLDDPSRYTVAAGLALGAEA